MSLYGVVRSTLRTGLRAYFSEIVTRGLENVPREGPVVLLANHHDSMIDPFLIVTTVERPVSFLAKAPLFRIPIMGAMLRAGHCIPAHRSQDAGYAKDKNERLYAAAGALLAEGRALGIFPEGKSHTDPHLAEFKHGAAKIAFEADKAGGVRVQLVAIEFEETRAFRGRVLMTFGPPMTLDAYRAQYATDPRAATAALTNDLHAQLSEMMASAEDREMMEMAELVERIGRMDNTLESVLERKRRLLVGEAELRRRAPEELARFKDSVRRYRRTLDLIGVRDEEIAKDFRPSRVMGKALRATFLFAATLPLFVVGIVCNFPPYLVAWIVSRFSGRSQDRRAAGGFLASLVVFPLFWALLAWWQWRMAGAVGLVAALAIAPLSGLIVLRWMDAWHDLVVSLWGLWTTAALPAARRKLRRMRAIVRNRLQRLAEKLA